MTRILLQKSQTRCRVDDSEQRRVT